VRIVNPFLAVLLVIAAIAFLVNVSPALAALAPLPAARSPFHLRDRFETDLFTGGAVYSYPLKVPSKSPKEPLTSRLKFLLITTA
jgi:hypothetical protein